MHDCLGEGLGQALLEGFIKPTPVWTYCLWLLLEGALPLGLVGHRLIRWVLTALTAVPLFRSVLRQGHTCLIMGEPV